MIPEKLRIEIDRYLGSSSYPFMVLKANANYESIQIGDYWILPMTEEEKTPATHWKELSEEYIELYYKDQTDPRLNEILMELKSIPEQLSVASDIKIKSIPNDLILLDKNRGIRKQWFELRSMYAESGIYFYQGFLYGEYPRIIGDDILIAMDGKDQYELLVKSHTQGNNHFISTDDMIKRLERLNEEFGLVVVFAMRDLVTFWLDRPVEREALPRIAQRLKRMCPDVEEPGAQLRRGLVTLWWD